MSIGRRQFLIGSTVAAAAAAQARTPENTGAKAAKLNRIAVMTLSFQSVLKSARYPGDSNRTLDILDAPQMLADRYGVHHVEFQHSHFASTDPAYLRELRGRLQKANSHANQICLEFGALNVSSPDPVLRLETIDLT